MEARALAKWTAEQLLSRAPTSWMGRIAHRGRGLILAYHNVVPDGMEGRGDRALHLPLSRFAEQMECLRRYAVPVSLDELLADGRRADAEGSRPRVAVTFDDAYRGAVTLGLGQAAARGIPATVFVAPALLGDRAFWWDSLAEAAVAPGHWEAIRSHALGKLGGVQDAVMAWADRSGVEAPELPPEMRSAREDEVAEAMALPGVCIGSHTWSHPSLPALGRRSLALELDRPVEWIRDRFPGLVGEPWLAFPYGHTSERIGRRVAREGYRGGLRVEGGWLPRLHSRSDRFSLPRLAIPAGLSTAGFRARLSGTVVDR